MWVTEKTVRARALYAKAIREKWFKRSFFSKKMPDFCYMFFEGEKCKIILTVDLKTQLKNIRWFQCAAGCKRGYLKKAVNMIQAEKKKYRDSDIFVTYVITSKNRKKHLAAKIFACVVGFRVVYSNGAVDVLVNKMGGSSEESKAAKDANDLMRQQIDLQKKEEQQKINELGQQEFESMRSQGSLNWNAPPPEKEV